MNQNIDLNFAHFDVSGQTVPVQYDGNAKMESAMYSSLYVFIMKSLNTYPSPSESFLGIVFASVVDQ